MPRSLLCPDAFLSPLEIDASVTRALAEDLGRAGDITATATIPEDTPARAIVVAREAGVISGLPLVAATFAKLAPDIEIAAHTRDGSAVAAKTALMTVAGPARAVLSAVAGGIAAVLKRAKAAAGHLVKIEIEVDTLDQLREVVEVGLADAVLLDNMDVATTRKAVEMVAGKFPLEASGGITLDTVAEIAKTGVDYASSGWITHSAPQLDVALDIEM